jgi:hypothetical protein
MRPDEVQVARNFLKLKGPGGCVGLQCKTYCADPAHAVECLAFAKTNRFISDAAAGVMDDIRSGAGPGGCKSPIECRTFCSDPANHDTCIQFATAHNIPLPRLMQMGNASSTTNNAQAAKIAAILASKPGPGGCTALQTCKQYCSDATHIAECVQFAKDNGLMTNIEVTQALKFVDPGPGGCLGEACKTYCSDPAHLEECHVFAIENGLTIKGDDGQFENGSSTRAVPRPPEQDQNAQGSSTRATNPALPAPPPMDETQIQIKAICAQYGGDLGRSALYKNQLRWINGSHTFANRDRNPAEMRELWRDLGRGTLHSSKHYSSQYEYERTTPTISYSDTLRTDFYDAAHRIHRIGVRDLPRTVSLKNPYDHK